MTSIATADLAAVMGGCKQGQPRQPDPSQGDPQQQQPQQGGGKPSMRDLLGGILGMLQQFLQPQQQQ